RLSGDDGAALRNISVTGAYDVENGWKDFELVSDDEGVVHLEHCADVPIKWRVNTPGYEAETKVIHHQADVLAEWALMAALPATGVVLDEKTGAPMAEALIYEVAREGGGNPGSYGGLDSFPLITQTDQQGRFTLDALRRDTHYRVMVESPGGARAFFEEVRAGDENLEFKVPSELSIRGTVTGALSRLPKIDDRPALVIHTSYKIGDSSFVSNVEQVPLDVAGDSATFVVDGLWKGNKQIELPDSRMQFELTESRHDFELVVPEAKEVLTRDVIVRFMDTDGVPPKGGIYVNYFKRLGGNSLDRVGPLEIEAEELHLNMLVPNTLSINPDGMVGYWFEQPTSDIPVGDGPFLVEVETWPAGSIQTTVTQGGATGNGSTNLSLKVVEPAPLLPQGHYVPYMTSVRKPGETIDRFIATPVPLGGTYRLVASRGWNYVVSDEIRLNDRNPAVAVELVIPEGLTFRGRVLSEAGEPLHGALISLSMDLDGGGGSYGRTDGAASAPDGSFEFTPVNPDFLGTYSLEVKGLRNFQAVRIADVDVSDFVEVRLPVGIEVTGKVLQPDGSPAPNVEVEAHGNGGPIFNLTEKCIADDEGSFEFSNLSGDVYTFSVGDRGQGWGAASTGVDVNTTRHVELRGELSGSR
ncbi:MAG: carboxypeptidase-like regulatory domain-containing protein, partial [Verrucomicrobiales bacterium]